MKKKNLLRLYTDEKGGLYGVCQDPVEATNACAKFIKFALAKGEQMSMNILFATTVRLLAADASGKMEDEYINKLRANVTAMREEINKDNEHR